MNIGSYRELRDGPFHWQPNDAENGSNMRGSALIREFLVDMDVNNGQSGWFYDWGEPTCVPQLFHLKVASGLLDQRDVPRGSSHLYYLFLILQNYAYVLHLCCRIELLKLLDRYNLV